METSRRKFQHPDLSTRMEAIEKLWDAWERLKTVFSGDKKKGLKALLDSVSLEPKFRDCIEQEARELTRIGNEFMIRHWETDKTSIRENDQIDYLFHRVFAMVLMLVRALDRDFI